MGLVGYEGGCVPQKGGLSRIALVEADGIAAADYDRARGVYRGITLAEGARFAEYEPAEDGAFYTERTTRCGASVSVVHSLTVGLEGMDAEAGCAARELMRAGADGLVAVVTLACGRRLLAGYSEKFGARYPLRLREGGAVTGARPQDRPGRTITLVSEDTLAAVEFVGEIPRGA